MGAESREATDSMYKSAIDYWSHIPATVNGVLGGYGHINTKDVSGSLSFIHNRDVQARLGPRPWRVVDCGAGIGRVTKNLLSKFADIIDIVEPVENFADQALKLNKALRDNGQLGDIYRIGLQDWEPSEDKYTIIWNQWYAKTSNLSFYDSQLLMINRCLGQLSDDDLVKYFERCKISLHRNYGCIVVKENMTFYQTVFDETDSSFTRSESDWIKLFKMSGLKILHQETQHGFPDELYTVKMFALIPL